jgi:hypothetical protein
MTASVKLYELSAARDILDGWLAESEGEVTPELEALLAELDANVDEKIERVALFVRERLATAAAVKEEVQRLQAIQKREEKAAESLKGYLLREMQRLGKAKVNGLLATVALQNNPPSVKGELAPDYLIELIGVDETKAFVTYVPESFALNRRAVLDAHKAGTPIPSGLTVEQGVSLRIR